MRKWKQRLGLLQVGENEIFELLNWRSFLVIKVGRLSTNSALHHEPGIQMVKDPGGETQKMFEGKSHC